MENHILEYKNTLQSILEKYNQRTEVKINVCEYEQTDEIMKDRYLEFDFNIKDFTDELADEILDFTFDCLINDGIEIIPSDKMVEILIENQYEIIF
ncbi:MAG: hypothetical protein J1F35_05840 [Erysipelotrichales bacterium]|nr:hypothetical protein [Erysipelotrichales bacterium]